jgi:hypothetical protein
VPWSAKQRFAKTLTAHYLLQYLKISASLLIIGELKMSEMYLSKAELMNVQGFENLNINFDNVRMFSLFLYRVRDAIGTLFRYDHPMQHPELSLRRLIMATRNHVDKDLVEQDTLRRFRALMSDLFMLTDQDDGCIVVAGVKSRSSLDIRGFWPFHDT